MKGENLLETAGRFGEKTTWSDKTRPRAAGVVRSKKITFSRKTRQNSKDLEKKFVEKFQD